MKTTEHQPPTTDLLGGPESGTLIGVHCALPVMPTLETALFIHSPLAFILTAISLRFALSAAGLTGSVNPLDGRNTLGAQGAFFDGLIFFRSHSRNKAIHLTQDYFRFAFPFLNAEMPENVEIAYFNDDEGAWVTVHPAVSPLPFERWMTPELGLERERINRESEQEMAAVVATLARATPPESMK